MKSLALLFVLAIPSLGSQKAARVTTLSPSVAVSNGTPQTRFVGFALGTYAPHFIDPGSIKFGVPSAAGVSSVPGAQTTASSLGPAESLKPASALVAEAIAKAQSVDQALAKAVELGAISAEQVPQDPTDRLFALKRLWDGVALEQPEPGLGVDRGWAVPAIKVQNGERTFLIHPVAHGQIFAPNARAVRKLVEQTRGSALLSEQGLPLHYGYNLGQETLDHGVDEGRPLSVVPAAHGAPMSAIKLARGLKNGLAAALAGLSVYVAVADPNWLTLGGLALTAFAFWLALTGFLPYYRWLDRRRAKYAESIGSPEMAAQRRRESQAFHQPVIDPADVIRLSLPPALGAAFDSWSPRSAAMAAAALGLSAKVVHVIVGWGHAGEIAWRLVGASPNLGTEAQDQGPENVGQKKSGAQPGGLI